MDLSLIIVMAFGLVSIVLDALLWGVTGYVLFRAVGGRRERWLVGALIVAALFFLWDSVIMSGIISMMGMSVENEGIAEMLGDSLGSIDLGDVLISFGSVIGGFKVGQLLVDRISTPPTQPVVSPLETPALPPTPPQMPYGE